uniref:Reverse transcriptase domain-containing protein n=2 Tax=Vitis vinifera TaxID=29760 RepID=A5C6D5_VITVI|nr:hypothetical protein VITISV_034267 [Vitis vinifera]
MTPHGLYCYKVMLFGLKNAGATYQRLMTKIFKSLIGRTVEIYIDDIVVKIKTWSEHAMHLEETFRLMRAYNMKLNLAKCFFGVSMGKFLGFMVMQRGIEVNPNQIRAILETHVHGSKKELQHLTGRLAALGYFIARFTNKLRPLFFTLKEVNKTNWTDDCKRAFDEPFALWGMDIVSPLPIAAAQKKLLLIATNYFSKWVESKAYASIKDKDVSKFVWRNIACLYGILQAIVLKIKNLYSMPRYPQNNGQAEATNKTLLIALKKRLEEAKEKWVDELFGVLWAYRTIPEKPIRTTPFTLAYGIKAIIPTEIGMPTAKTTVQGQRDENQELKIHLDQADKSRGNVAI